MRSASVGSVVVVVLVLVAGCSGALGGDRPAGGDGTATTTATDTQTTRAWDGDQDNPWRAATLTVAVVVETDTEADRPFRTFVREAVTYWERNAKRYAGYPIDYRLLPAANTTAGDGDGDANADVVIHFVDRVGECGTADRALGCAPVVTAPPAPRPADVRVIANLSNASTISVIRHELGHTLGLDHDDAPQAVMAADRLLFTLPQPDATERPLPWNRSTLRVHVADDALSPARRPAAADQIRAALAYYADGAAGTVPTNLSFTHVDDPDRADVRIRFVETPSCGSDAGSCFSSRGIDPDGDDRIERYVRADIEVATDLDTDAVAWHVGRWLGAAMGFDEATDWPVPLRQSADAAERRSQWWR